MTEYDVKRLALVLAIQAEIEALKVDNKLREYEEGSPMWSGDHFACKAEELRVLAAKHDHQL